MLPRFVKVESWPMESGHHRHLLKSKSKNSKVTEGPPVSAAKSEVPETQEVTKLVKVPTRSYWRAFTDLVDVGAMTVTATEMEVLLPFAWLHKIRNPIC